MNPSTDSGMPLRRWLVLGAQLHYYSTMTRVILRPIGVDRGMTIPDSFFEPLPDDLFYGDE